MYQARSLLQSEGPQELKMSLIYKYIIFAAYYTILTQGENLCTIIPMISTNTRVGDIILLYSMNKNKNKNLTSKFAMC